ncbi:MAG: hypothetical protein ACYTEZ_19050 [Planctomycetota bacterium]|jgi:hypothetical protein
MDQEHMADMHETLRVIAAGIDRIGAALTVGVCDRLKGEVIGGSEISSDTQQIVRTAERLRNKALAVLAKSFPRT